MTLSFVIPTLDESAVLGPSLCALVPQLTPADEVFVVDGGSTDATREAATTPGVRLLTSERGRARQLNVGARAARGAGLVFLHADTRLPERGVEAIRTALDEPATAWGHFGLALDGSSTPLRVVEWGIALRDRLGFAPTGDQALFVRRDVFVELGGFPEIAIMEDLALARALGRRSPPRRLDARVETSARRWRSRGVVRTVLLMWFLRAASRVGASPDRLARLYRDVR